jgi:hypothetical protein
MSELDRARPRSVLVVRDDHYIRMLGDPNALPLINDVDAMVVPYSHRPEVHEGQVSTVRKLLQSSGQLVAGALLIKNPYESGRYEQADHALETFASAKYHAMAEVARLLGARDVSFVEAKIENTVSGWNGGNKLKVPGLARGQGSIEREVKKNVKGKLDLRLQFPGSAPDPVQASAYLVQHNLQHDPRLQSLVRMRTGDNLVRLYEMTLNGTMESAANVKSALNIASAGPIRDQVTLGGTFIKTAKSIMSIEITTVITF